MDLSKVSFVESAFWDDNMAEYTKWLRENDPVYWSEKDQLWVVTKYEDVTYISKNQELFTSGQGVRPTNPVKIGLIDEGEPRHSQLRRLLNKGFTPRMVGKLEEAFLKIVDDALDNIGPKGECDFVEEVSVPLPLLIIAEMIGVRPEDRDRFHHWSDMMIAAEGAMDDPEVMAEAGKAFVEYSEYVTEILDDRRANPKDDLCSVLVNAEEDGILTTFDLDEVPESVDDEHKALVNQELIMLCVILLVAGNETTRNAISGGMQLLIENPEERQKLIDDPSLIPGACEEMLRLISPVHSFSRTITADTELHGRQLKKDQKVLMIYPSANRDADQFDDPDTFKAERSPEHLAFGIGSHFCLGASLARMELRVTFREVLRRFPDMEYSAGGPVIKPSALVRSCMEMMVKYTPEESPQRASA